MRNAAASVLVALGLFLASTGTAAAHSAPRHPAAKRCLTRACRKSRARGRVKGHEAIAQRARHLTRKPAKKPTTHKPVATKATAPTTTSSPSSPAAS
ncbi:MAG: hypothetical protein ACXVR1_09945, partial [Solirubrobacteraceae bacterium]